MRRMVSAITIRTIDISYSKLKWYEYIYVIVKYIFEALSQIMFQQRKSVDPYYLEWTIVAEIDLSDMCPSSLQKASFPVKLW
jgi:hypothetical protein